MRDEYRNNDGTFVKPIGKTLNTNWIKQGYSRFFGLLSGITKIHNLRGYRIDYVLGKSPRYSELFDNYRISQEPWVADELLEFLDTARREK